MTTRRDAPGTTEQDVDPRAVRVRLGPASAHAEVPPLVVPPSGEPMAVTLEPAGRDRWRLVGLGDGRPSRAVRIDSSPGSPGTDGVLREQVVLDGWLVEVEVEPERRAILRARATRGRRATGADGPAEVRAIIPGAVLSVAVAAGDEIEAGQALVVVEAMKMQNEIRSPRAGRIGRVAVGAGQKLEVGDLLVVIESNGTDRE